MPSWNKLVTSGSEADLKSVQTEKISGNFVSMEAQKFRSTGSFSVGSNQFDISNPLYTNSGGTGNRMTDIAISGEITDARVVDGDLQTGAVYFLPNSSTGNNLDVTFGYTSMDGKNGTKDAREIPESMYSLWANYEVNPKLGWAVGVMHQGESLIKDGGTQMLPDYTRVDAAVYLMLSNDFRLQVNMENLTDELYFPHSHSTHQVSVGRERNIRLSLTRNF